MLAINQKDMARLFETIQTSYALYAPVEQAGSVLFGEWSRGKKLRLDALQTVKSAKECFFPQTETLYHAKREGKRITIQPPKTEAVDTVYFGVRGCDGKSFSILDTVFLSEPADVYYKEHREHATIVSMACHAPEKTCFCMLFGVNAAKPDGDVVTWMVGEWLYWQPMTEKGEKLTCLVRDCFQEKEDSEVEDEQQNIREKMTALPLHKKLNLEGLDGAHLNEIFDSPKWETLSRACLGCGTCTFVCPTCQCYDIRDYDTGHGIQKFRCWDSCMYSDFTMMAHGNNRTTQLQRFRQRFMHKLVYFPSNHDGVYGCVGCGRCLKSCPQSLNIARVILALGGKSYE